MQLCHKTADNAKWYSVIVNRVGSLEGHQVWGIAPCMERADLMLVNSDTFTLMVWRFTCKMIDYQCIFVPPVEMKLLDNPLDSTALVHTSTC